MQLWIRCERVTATRTNINNETQQQPEQQIISDDDNSSSDHSKGSKIVILQKNKLTTKQNRKRKVGPIVGMVAKKLKRNTTIRKTSKRKNTEPAKGTSIVAKSEDSKKVRRVQ